MMDIVFIKNLQVKTVIGVFDWEREIRQIVSLDLEMAHDIRKAAASDDLDYALDYKAVSDRLSDFIEQSQFKLIETLAEQVAEIVQSEFSVPWLRLCLTKPGAVPATDGVGLVIERGVKP